MSYTKLESPIESERLVAAQLAEGEQALARWACACGVDFDPAPERLVEETATIRRAPAPKIGRNNYAWPRWAWTLIQKGTVASTPVIWPSEALPEKSTGLYLSGNTWFRYSATTLLAPITPIGVTGFPCGCLAETGRFKLICRFEKNSGQLRSSEIAVPPVRMAMSWSATLGVQAVGGRIRPRVGPSKTIRLAPQYAPKW